MQIGYFLENIILHYVSQIVTARTDRFYSKGIKCLATGHCPDPHSGSLQRSPHRGVDPYGTGGHVPQSQPQYFRSDVV